MPHHHRIREVRLQLQVSIRTLANWLELTIGEARQLESPTSDVSLSVLKKIATHFQVPVGDLICEGDNDEVHRLRGFVIRVLKTCGALLKRLPEGAGRQGEWPVAGWGTMPQGVQPPSAGDVDAVRSRAAGAGSAAEGAAEGA